MAAREGEALIERLLAKPLQGGLFGQDQYQLASMPCVAQGLHSVRYLVIERRAGLVVSVGDDKQQALAGARRVITAAGEVAAANDERIPQQGQLWAEADLPAASEATAPAAAPVSRRRREIFEKSEGRCHYCRSELQLAGPWHVEHMQPRALGGRDDFLNLVAACVACNLGKADRTALEFVVRTPAASARP